MASALDPQTRTVTITDDMTGAVIDEYVIPQERWDELNPPQSEIDARNNAIYAAQQAVAECRASLNDAVQLAALSPYPTPEEQAIIDAQVADALALFRGLHDPPTDVIALATAVLTLGSDA